MIDKEKIKKAVRMILEAIGEDPDREGLRDTPQRVADMFEELLEGYYREEEETAQFTERSDLIVVGPIRFYSLCEHHLLPFFGYVYVAYIPKGKVIGISKIIKVVNKYSRRLQLQERMTEQIADELSKLTGSDDVLVLVRGRHMCIEMRGVKAQSRVTTLAIRGEFIKNFNLRAEVMGMLAKEPPET